MFFHSLYGTWPPLFLGFFYLSVKLYDNDYAKDVNFLQHIQSPVEMFEGHPIIFDG